MLTRHPPEATGHPSYHCYRYHKCRCADCVECQRVVRARYYEKVRARRHARPRPMPTTIVRLYREIGLKWPLS
jgi:hypothetical protein